MLKMFYFSGTGNALAAAKVVTDAWKAAGRDADLVDISKIDRGSIDVAPDDEIGIASPTHGFNFPPITLSFIFRFPRTRTKNRVMILNTRGGTRFFGRCLPGVSGIAQLLAAVVFLIKGYRVVGMRPVDLPSNWISLHPGLRQGNIEAIYAKCEKPVRRSAERWIAGGRDLRALYDLPIDLLIAPIAIGYYLVGRFVLAKSFVASRACNNCGLCVEQCPVHGVVWVRERPFWTHRCESCMRCMNRCPTRAIETAHGFVFGLLFLLNAAAVYLLYPILFEWIPALSAEGTAAGAIRYVLKTVFTVLMFFASYRGLHFLLRFSVVERVVFFSALSHFKWWRRYRAPKQRHSPAADVAEPIERQ